MATVQHSVRIGPLKLFVDWVFLLPLGPLVLVERVRLYLDVRGHGVAIQERAAVLSEAQMVNDVQYRLPTTQFPGIPSIDVQQRQCALSVSWFAFLWQVRLKSCRQHAIQVESQCADGFMQPHLSRQTQFLTAMHEDNPIHVRFPIGENLRKRMGVHSCLVLLWVVPDL